MEGSTGSTLDWRAAYGDLPPGAVRRTVGVDGDGPAHDHDFGEIVLVRAGEGSHLTSDGETALSPGDLLVFRPGVWHAYRACRGLVVTNVNYPPALVRATLRSLVDGRVVRLLMRAERCALLRPLSDLAPVLNAPPEGPTGETGRLLVVLQAVADALPPGAPALHPAVERAAAALERDPARASMAAELGREAGMHPAGLARRFATELGQPPLVWLRTLRMERAARLLRDESLPIGAVGDRAGYPDPNLFARRFRATFGLSPTAYRTSARPARQEPSAPR